MQVKLENATINLIEYADRNRIETRMSRKQGLLRYI